MLYIVPFYLEHDYIARTGSIVAECRAYAYVHAHLWCISNLLILYDTAHNIATQLNHRPPVMSPLYSTLFSYSAHPLYIAVVSQELP
jgi:hypothetical protein